MQVPKRQHHFALLLRDCGSPQFLRQGRLRNRSFVFIGNDLRDLAFQGLRVEIRWKNSHIPERLHNFICIFLLDPEQDLKKVILRGLIQTAYHAQIDERENSVFVRKHVSVMGIRVIHTLCKHLI